MPIEIISYRDLDVWQQAMDLADLVYDITEKFPPRERFTLAQHMRKSAATGKSSPQVITGSKTAVITLVAPITNPTP